MPFPIVADSFGQWTSLANQAETSDTAEYFTALANARAEKALRMQEQEQQFQQVARAMALQQQQQQIDLEANRTAAALQQQRFQNAAMLRNQELENERNRHWYDIYSERNALQQARNEAQDAFNRGHLAAQTELGRERNAIARAKLDADIIAKRTPKAANATTIDKAVQAIHGGANINEVQAAYGLSEEQRPILVQAGKDAFKDRQDVIKQAEKYAAELNAAAETWAKTKPSWGRDTRTNEQLQNYLAGKVAEIVKATATRDRPQGLMEFIEVPQWNGTTILKGGHTFDSSFLEPFMKFAPLTEGEPAGGENGRAPTNIPIPKTNAIGVPAVTIPGVTNAPAAPTQKRIQYDMSGNRISGISSPASIPVSIPSTNQTAIPMQLPMAMQLPVASAESYPQYEPGIYNEPLIAKLPTEIPVNQVSIGEWQGPPQMLTTDTGPVDWRTGSSAGLPKVIPVRIENPLPTIFGTAPKWLFDQLSKL